MVLWSAIKSKIEVNNLVGKIIVMFPILKFCSSLNSEKKEISLTEDGLRKKDYV